MYFQYWKNNQAKPSYEHLICNSQIKSKLPLTSFMSKLIKLNEIVEWCSSPSNLTLCSLTCFVVKYPEGRIGSVKISPVLN